MSEDNANVHYVGEAGRSYHNEKRSIPEATVPWIANLRAEKISPHISATDTILEFGVGSGWNLAQLRCGKRLGYDISTFLESAVQKHGIEFVADLANVSKSSVDIVLCHHALEHLLNPAAVLRQTNDLLRPGGKLLLFVPYEKEHRYQSYNSAEPNHHLYSWNVQTLGNLVEQIGFKLIEGKIGRFGYDRFAANWAMRLGVGETGFRFIRALLHLVKPVWEVRIVAIKK